MEYEEQEDKQLTTLIKITMPKTYANKFLAESKTTFLNARYLNIMFKDLMFNALYNNADEDVKAAINKALQEMKSYRDQEIKGMAQQLSFYKNKVKEQLKY